jgi:hypothetical protein
MGHPLSLLLEAVLVANGLGVLLLTRAALSLANVSTLSPSFA